MNITVVDQTIIGILVPFLGTSLGATLVFFLKKEIKPIIQKILLGFASGVMIAASVWSLLLPAIEMAENQNKVAWVPATVGFALGVIVLILIILICIVFYKNREKENTIKKLNYKVQNIEREYEILLDEDSKKKEYLDKIDELSLSLDTRKREIENLKSLLVSERKEKKRQ